MSSDLAWMWKWSSTVDTVINKHLPFSPFKFQSQKRNSTDAGVQTEPVTVAPAEKTK